MFRKNVEDFFKMLDERGAEYKATDPGLFDRIKKERCNLCECNVNIPDDVVCDDCIHYNINVPRNNGHLRHSFSTIEERAKRKAEIDAELGAQDSFVCANCGRRFYNHYKWDIDGCLPHCLDCFKTHIECQSVLSNKTGLAGIVRHLNVNTIKLHRKIRKEDADTSDKIEKIKDDLYNELIAIIRTNLHKGFYSEYKHTNWPNGEELEISLEYCVLTPTQKKRLITMAYEKDHYTDEKTLDEWLKKGLNNTDLSKSVEK